MIEKGLVEFLKTGGGYNLQEGEPEKIREFKKWFIGNGKLFKKIGDSKPFIKRMRHKPKEGRCHQNSLTAIKENKNRGLKFYTGYAFFALIPGVPFLHSFNVLNDEVIDTTRNYGLEYFGVEIPYEFVLKLSLGNWVQPMAMIYFMENIYKNEAK